MSARDEILQHPGVLATADAAIGPLLDRHRAEVLRKAADSAEQEFIYGIAPAASERDEIWDDAVRAVATMLRGLADEDGEKTTAAAAAVTPQPTAGWHAARALASRLDRLLDLIRAEGGEWRTGRVHRIYRAVEDAPQRVTARRDLEALHALGWLERHTAPGDCFYTLNTRKDGRS